MIFTKENYLLNKQHFNLGNLTTESRHQKTMQLSRIVKEDLLSAIELLKDIDSEALGVLEKKSDQFFKLQNHCQSVLKNQGKIFIVGCGATGRLALSVEKLFREIVKTDQVVSFMAGGDYALIKSIEKFEDSFDYGKRQLNELGFNPETDILLAVTEGGETSFVIGALEEASSRSKNSCWFLYCNPDSELVHVQRSARVLNNPKIEKLNLTVGPMALTGSTRMQATTVQMIAVATALLYQSENQGQFDEFLKDNLNWLRSLDLNFLNDLIEYEYNCYQEKELMTYVSSPDLAIAILTDTTERSPTFNMTGFEKIGEKNKSLVYLAVDSTADVELAWTQLLGRTPRCLDWEEFRGEINFTELKKFDISSKAVERRQSKMIKVEDGIDHVKISWPQNEYKFPIENRDLFWKHMMLKVVLNIHSTLLMGKLGRFEGNLMTYVRPSNFKLVNRAFRYIAYFLEERDREVDHDKIIDLIFEHQKENQPDSPVVISVLNKLGVFL